MKQVRSLAAMAVGLAAAAGIDVRALGTGPTQASGANTSKRSFGGTVTVKLGTGSSHKQNRRKQLLRRRKR